MNQVRMEFLEHRTTSFDQDTILNSIIDLHCPWGIEADVTYSIGSFYKNGVPDPKYRFELFPQTHGVMQADCTRLPVANGAFRSVMFDPPFLVGPPNKGKHGLMKDRFSVIHKNIKALWEFYEMAIKELARALSPAGVLIFKCQDIVSSGRNHFSHVEVMNMAVAENFYPKDLFILLAKYRMGNWHSNRQFHARKYHSYFWVFVKKE